VAFLKANGAEAAAAEFTNGKGFKDRDLYVVYEKFDGTMLANGGNAKLVGKNLAEFKDADGKLFNRMLVETAKTKGKGWSESYKFMNPMTQKIGEKIMYVERVDDAWIGVGVYK
jgi:signal transduction histidine kinase